MSENLETTPPFQASGMNDTMVDNEQPNVVLTAEAEAGLINRKYKSPAYIVVETRPEPEDPLITPPPPITPKPVTGFPLGTGVQQTADGVVTLGKVLGQFTGFQPLAGFQPLESDADGITQPIANTSNPPISTNTGDPESTTTETKTETTPSVAMPTLNLGKPVDREHEYLQKDLKDISQENFIDANKNKENADENYERAKREYLLYNQMNPQSPQQGGGSGGFFNLIKTLASSVAEKGGRGEQLKNEFQAAATACEKAKTQVDRVASRDVPHTMENFNDLYLKQKTLADKVNAFNNELTSRPDGKSFLEQMESNSKLQPGGEKALKSRMRDPSDKDPTIEKLRRQEASLAQDPILAPQLREIQEGYEDINKCLKKTQTGIENLSDNNVKLDDFGSVSDKITKMNVPNTKIGTPDGLQTDKMSEDLKAKFQEFAERIREMVQRFLSTFGLER